MFTRRSFLKAGAGVGAAAFLPLGLHSGKAAAAAAGPLDPLLQPRFVNPLPNPLDPGFIFVPTGFARDPENPRRAIPAFDLQIRQIKASYGLRDPRSGRLLGTTSWGYGTARQAATVPGRSFLIPRGTRVQVTYNNRLLDARGQPLPHLLPIDTTIDWANPGNLGALAPVPLVAHLHGSDSQYLSDGLPDAWETPGEDFTGGLWSKPYIYDNSQEAGHLWYHDHALGITRLNVYAGLAGNYFIRGEDETWLAAHHGLPAWPYEIPLVLQDHQFLANGEMFYPSEDPEYAPFAPTHLPEFFGDVMLVNGMAWPQLAVEPRPYRLRLLNGSDSRVYELRIETGTAPGAGQRAPMYVVGNELGLLNAPVPVEVLRIAPGERYDIVVDFSALKGRALTLTNSANAPYPDADAPVPGVSDQLMQFRVVKALGKTPRAVLPDNLRPISGPLPPALPATAATRRILLVEGTDKVGRLMTMLGPIDPEQSPLLQGTLFYKDPVTERPRLGSTEIWEFYNTTVDAHPIHMHLVDFRVLDRQPFTLDGGDPNAGLEAKDMGDGYTGGIIRDPASIGFSGAAEAPGAWEAGRKDTAVMFPGTVTRVMATFRRPGTYVYHCHILSHEDHEMMRPFEVAG